MPSVLASGFSLIAGSIRPPRARYTLSLIRRICLLVVSCQRARCCDPIKLRCPKRGSQYGYVERDWARIRSRLAVLAAAPQSSPAVVEDPQELKASPEPPKAPETPEIDDPAPSVGEGRCPAFSEPRRSSRAQSRNATRIMSVNRKIMVSEAEADRMWTRQWG